VLNALKLDTDRAMLLVVDLQTRLLPHIDGAEDITRAAAKLVRGAALFELPILATTQYVKGLGPIHETVAGLLADVQAPMLEKATFSVCGDAAMKAKLAEIDRPQIIVAGIEGHVCVLQTVLDLLSMDHAVHVCIDAVGSRNEMDLEVAISRMQQAGAVVTTVEAALFELCYESGTDRFKSLLELVK
jgi:nicotinamidase-related amidase